MIVHREVAIAVGVGARGRNMRGIEDISINERELKGY